MSGHMIIDALAFAREAQILEASLPVSVFSRLHDLLNASAQITDLDDFHFRLTGRENDQNEAQLVLTVKGVLPLTCQRCLESIDVVLDFESVLELVTSDEAITQDELEDDSHDYIVAEREMDVMELIEDEVILALPIVPTHTDCVLPQIAQVEKDSEKANPFSALAGIKGKTSE